MALKNYLVKGSYSIVDAHQYSKQNSWLRFYLKIFKDETKTVLLAEKFFDISGHQSHRAIGQDTLVPPEHPSNDDSYIVLVGASGEWEGRQGCIAVWDDSHKSWGFWGFGAGQIFYSAVDDLYFTLDPQQLTKTQVYPLDDARQWAKWFSTSMIFSNTTNIYKQSYAFLKAQPGFEEVVDC